MRLKNSKNNYCSPSSSNKTHLSRNTGPKHSFKQLFKERNSLKSKNEISQWKKRIHISKNKKNSFLDRLNQNMDIKQDLSFLPKQKMMNQKEIINLFDFSFKYLELKNNFIQKNSNQNIFQIVTEIPSCNYFIS